MIAIFFAMLTAWAAPVTEAEVISSALSQSPEMAAASAAVEAAEADVLWASGSFDPTLVTDGAWYGGGYPRQVLDVGAAVETSVGPSFGAGYRIGRGDFPTYDERFTSSLGEVYANVEIPILQGLGFSKERATLLKARVSVDAERARFEDQRRTVTAKAAKAYWAWVAAGANYRLAVTQLELAEARNEALTTAWERGDRPELDVVDNQRALMVRKQTVYGAEAELRQAALRLGYWLRTPSGAPNPPSDEQLIPLTADAPSELTSQETATLLAQRPDIRAAQSYIEALRIERKRSRQAVLPKLSVKAEASIPLADDDKPEYVGGLVLSSSFLQRSARGDRQRADADLAQAEAKLQKALDRNRLEAEANAAALQLAWRQVEAAEQGRQLAERTVDMTRRSFDLGAADLFTLLAREDQLAKASQAAIKAFKHYREAAVAQRALLNLPSE